MATELTYYGVVLEICISPTPSLSSPLPSLKSKSSTIQSCAPSLQPKYPLSLREGSGSGGSERVGVRPGNEQEGSWGEDGP